MRHLGRNRKTLAQYDRAVVARFVAAAAALVFATFVAAKGIPTLRHDWSWPIDRVAVPSFINESIGGWLPSGFGAVNAHPTAYLIALPLGLAMWVLGPLAALVLFAFAIGYACVQSAASLSREWCSTAPFAVGIGLFALFNPWVYNETVAGHLVMVLAYAGFLGLCAEMLRGSNASVVRLALWLALIETQLQFFLVAMAALVIFAFATRKWMAPVAGVILVLPSAIGLVAERATILQTPYNLAWQANQSVDPGALVSLNGYFPGYADRMGPAAAVAVWVVVAMACAGAIVMRRSAVAGVAAAAAVFYVAITGVHGPLAVPYEWVVREVPESGVFRELYDLAGILAALLAVLACAAVATLPYARYVALAAGIVLPVTWLLAPPSYLWVGAREYLHPSVAAPAFTRVALLPAFQPLGLRGDGGDGADPDAHSYPDHVVPVNEYFPTYPVDMALARYAQSGDVAPLQALGVAELVGRAWLQSRSNGRIGLAATSLAPARRSFSGAPIRQIENPMPLISKCTAYRVVALGNRLDACSTFFGDVSEGYPEIRPVRRESDSIDPRTDWIDARLAFTAVPELAQAIGGVVTQSAVPYPVEPGWTLLAYVRGGLNGADGRTLVQSTDGFRWIPIPLGVTAVRCAGLCELVAESRSAPQLPFDAPVTQPVAMEFRTILPWLFVVRGSIASVQALRLNERYDAGWIAIRGWRILPHVRIDMAANGWLSPEKSSSAIILVQVTSLLQMIADLCGIVLVLCLLKAATRAPTKRV
ncbi:MAG TPA: hypothetical protein VFE35_02380 [Candidatus Cybelea sp.]|nr:hypothetical protein [Candidatus Cybelea sp.]